MKNLIILLCLSALSLIIAPSCSEPATSGDNFDSENAGYIEPNSLEVTHVKGTSPCPQLVGQATIYKTSISGSLKAIDSVNVDANTIPAGIEMALSSNGGLSSAMDSSELVLGVFFTCNPPQSVNDFVEVEYYANNQYVGLDVLKVKVLVQE